MYGEKQLGSQRKGENYKLRAVRNVLCIHFIHEDCLVAGWILSNYT
jgi:hypothetical protein